MKNLYIRDDTKFIHKDKNQEEDAEQIDKSNTEMSATPTGQKGCN